MGLVPNQHQVDGNHLEIFHRQLGKKCVFNHAFAWRKRSGLLHTDLSSCNKGIWPCWALFFGFVKDLQGELVRLLNLQYLNCAVAQLLTRPCQTTPYKSSIIIGPRTCSKYVESLCSSYVTRKVWKCVKYHRPTASASLDQILRGGCTKPMKLPHKTVLFKIHSANPLVLSEFNSTAGRKSMPEFSSQCRGRKSRNQHIYKCSIVFRKYCAFSKRCGTLFKDILHTLISRFSPEMPCSGQRPLRAYHTEKESMFTQCFIAHQQKRMQSFWEVLCIWSKHCTMWDMLYTWSASLSMPQGIPPHVIKSCCEAKRWNDAFPWFNGRKFKPGLALHQSLPDLRNLSNLLRNPVEQRGSAQSLPHLLRIHPVDFRSKFAHDKALFSEPSPEYYCAHFKELTCWPPTSPEENAQERPHFFKESNPNPYLTWHPKPSQEPSPFALYRKPVL